ncbi:uncharacterized protein L203_104034 [Cryptococcus depauperatus CBS 7841]|uniref:Uncharacterized protein n=1 Tax=Cryptococcus depauperatus CBS 7841 TaxID=1295531 RepID=A0A1E3IBP5_9TREE|nr:hypothetical protein L203_04517 [Cryptococcus depauperatus CBS 7841]
MIKPHISFRKGDRERHAGLASPVLTPYNQTPAIMSSDADSPTFKYNPARLLRRKASFGDKTVDVPTGGVDVDAPVTASSIGSFYDAERAPFPYGLGDDPERDQEDDDEKEWSRLFTRNLSKSRKEIARRPSFSSRRAVWVYKQRSHDGNLPKQMPVKISQHAFGDSDVFCDLGSEFDNLGVRDTAGRVKNGINEKIAKDQDALVVKDIFPFSPLTPSSSSAPNSSTMYPTALSPPRRPIHFQPQTMQQLRQKKQSQNTFVEAQGERPTTLVTSISKEFGVTKSPSQLQICVPPRPRSQPQRPRTPVITAEWLKRKPSSGKLKHNPSFSPGNIPLPSPPVSAKSLMSTPSPHPIRNISRSTVEKSPFMMVETASGCLRTISRSSTDSETNDTISSSEDELGFVCRSTPAASFPTSSIKDSVNSQGNGYEVQISCSDDRVESDTMKWEVVVRRRSSKGTVLQSGHSQRLGTAPSISYASSTTSSINLSLSLDQPTGNLVFISFPTDVYGTPTKRQSSSHSQPPSKDTAQSVSRNNSFGSIYRSTTPPLETGGCLTSNVPRPTTSPSVRKKPPPIWLAERKIEGDEYTEHS